MTDGSEPRTEKPPFRCPRDFDLGSLGGSDYFVADPERFQTEMTSLLARLGAAFRQVEGTSPFGDGAR